MSTRPLTPAKPRGISRWIAFNIFAAVVWALTGVGGFILSFLDDVHGWLPLVPLLLVPAGWLSRMAAAKLNEAATDRRLLGTAILYLGSAIACVLGFSLLIDWFIVVRLQEGDLFRHPLATLLLHYPAILALFAFVEVVYLRRVRSSFAGN